MMVVTQRVTMMTMVDAKGDGGDDGGLFCVTRYDLIFRKKTKGYL